MRMHFSKGFCALLVWDHNWQVDFNDSTEGDSCAAKNKSSGLNFNMEDTWCHDFQCHTGEHDTKAIHTEEIIDIAYDALDAVGFTNGVPKQVAAQAVSPNASLAWEAVGEVRSCTDKEIAMDIKRKLDEKFGGTWHVIVGTHFGGNITSDTETLSNFQIDKRHFLVFRSGPPDRPSILESSGDIAEI